MTGVSLLARVAQQLILKALVINDAGHLLMIQRPSSIPLRERWDLPGGPLLVGADLEDGMRHAVLADTGLSVDPGPLVHAWETTNTCDGQLLQKVVLARVCRLSRTPASDAQELTLPADWQHRLCWLALDQLRCMRVAGDLAEVLDLYRTHREATSRPATDGCEDSG